MTDELDNQSASETEGELDTNLENGTELTVDDYNKQKELANNQKIRAEKAERELKELKSKQEKLTPKNDETLEQKPNEPNYSQLAFLEGRGVQHPDDQKIVQDEANRLKLPLTDILQMEHIKAKLKANSSQREAEAGMPQGSGGGSSSTKNSVEYWIDKKNDDGGFATPPNAELHKQVIAARLKKQNNSNMFSDDMY